MSHQELAATQEVNPSIRKSYFQMANSHGVFYDSLLNNYLDPRRALNIHALVNGLPRHARPLYRKGIQVLEDSLAVNNAFVSQEAQGQEVAYLLPWFLQTLGLPEEEISDTVKKYTSQTKLYVPTNGLYLLRAEELFRHLSRRGKRLIPLGVQGYACQAETGDEPSFIVVRNYERFDRSNPEWNKTQQHQIERHELHHLFWNWLNHAGMIREAEGLQGDADNFDEFRYEFIGHLLSNSHVNNLGVDRLTYTDNDETLNNSQNTLNAISSLVEIFNARGISHLTLIYPLMTSTNFNHLRRNISLLNN